MKHSRKEYFIMSAIICFLSIIALISAFSIPAGGNLGRGADFMPKIVSVVLLCCGIGFFILGILTPQDKSAPKTAFKKDPVPVLRFGVALGMLLIYVALLKLIGFIIMTTLYIFVQSLFMAPPEKRNYCLSAVLSLVVSILIYFVFARGLGMTLPNGVLGGIL